CFFSSRRRHTRCYRDWSSDVCSSDLSQLPLQVAAVAPSITLCGDRTRGPGSAPRAEIRQGDRRLVPTATPRQGAQSGRAHQAAAKTRRNQRAAKEIGKRGEKEARCETRQEEGCPHRERCS